MSDLQDSPLTTQPGETLDATPVLNPDLNRRSFLKTAMATGAGAWFANQNQAIGAMLGFDSTLSVNSPLSKYPNRSWEKTYRNLYQYDSTFNFLCAPNDTHNCLLTAYVKNGVMIRIGPSFGFGKATDTEGFTSSHRWDPRCCQKGLALVRKFYGDRRVKSPMVRTGYLDWVKAGFPRDPVSGKVPDQYLNRGTDPYVRVSWEEAYDLHAQGLQNVAQTYSGEEGKKKLLAQGYDPAMVEATQGAGVQTLKFRGGMACLGAVRLQAQYRLSNMMALLDSKVRSVGPDQATGARGWDNYSWHTDLPPGHTVVSGQQTIEWDLCNVEHSNMVVIWGMNWITTKMPDSHWLTEARIKGTKVVVIACEYSATCNKADEILVVRPGVTPALALGFSHVILKEKSFDKDFVSHFTDLPMLVREDTLQPLMASEVFPDYQLVELKNATTVLKAGEMPVAPALQSGSIIPQALRQEWGDYVVYDTKTKSPKAVSRDMVGEHSRKSGIVPLLEGVVEIKLANGQTVKAKPVFDHMKKLVMDSYDPKTVSELTWAPEKGIVSLARQFAKNKGKTLFGLGMGPNQFFNSDLKDRAVFFLAALTGNIGKIGGNVGSYAGNYRAAFFSGLPNYVAENPFNIQKDPDGPVNKKLYSKAESVHYWNHGDTILRQGKEILTGHSHMPTPTKTVHVSNSNSLIGNAKGHFEAVFNTMRKCELVAVNEWWWTASCEYADIVYAIDSWAETKFPDMTISVTNPFLYVYPDTPMPRIHDTRSDLEVAAGVGKAVGKLIGDSRADDYWKFVEEGKGLTYFKRILESSNVSKGYDAQTIINNAKEGIPAQMLTRTYPKIGAWEQTNEGKPHYTKTGRLEFFRFEQEFRDAGECLPLHREPIDSTFLEPNVIVAKPHPLITPKTPEDYGVNRSDLSVDARQARNVQKDWAALKVTQHPLLKDGYKFIFHTPKYRHGTHTTPVDIDIIAVWFGPFTDMHRRDKRMPYVGEAYVDMNPKDAQMLGIEDGDYVYIDADPSDRPFKGWQDNPEAYKVARLMARARYYPGTPRGITRMWHNMYGSTIGTVKAMQERSDGLAKNTQTNYQSMFRSGSQQSCTRGYLKPTWMTESLVRKDLGGQVIGKGFEPDVHCPTGAPREAIVKITKAEDGGMNGKGLWEPAKKGLRPTYENAALKKFIAGNFVKKS